MLACGAPCSPRHTSQASTLVSKVCARVHNRESEALSACIARLRLRLLVSRALARHRFVVLGSLCCYAGLCSFAVYFFPKKKMIAIGVCLGSLGALTSVAGGLCFRDNLPLVDGCARPSSSRLALASVKPS